MFGAVDLYRGDCRGCGGCCGRYVPVSAFDLARLEGYLRGHEVTPNYSDGMCPFLSADRTCMVYEARPQICRVYRCDRHASGELFARSGEIPPSARVTDMAELARGAVVPHVR